MRIKSQKPKAPSARNAGKSSKASGATRSKCQKTVKKDFDYMHSFMYEDDDFPKKCSIVAKNSNQIMGVPYVYDEKCIPDYDYNTYMPKPKECKDKKSIKSCIWPLLILSIFAMVILEYGMDMLEDEPLFALPFMCTTFLLYVLGVSTFSSRLCCEKYIKKTLHVEELDLTFDLSNLLYLLFVFRLFLYLDKVFAHPMLWTLIIVIAWNVVDYLCEVVFDIKDNDDKSSSDMNEKDEDDDGSILALAAKVVIPLAVCAIYGFIYLW